MTDASPNSMPLMTGLTGPLCRRGAPGGLSEAVLGAALCGSMEGLLVAPGQRVGGNTNALMRLSPRNSDALVVRDGFRTLAEGAKLESRPGETATRSRTTSVWVI